METQDGCMDCGRAYPHGLDMVLTKKQWLEIHPDDGGVLCPSCLVNRAEKLPGSITVLACIVTGEHLDSPDSVEGMLHALRLENADLSRERAEALHDLRSLRESGVVDALRGMVAVTAHKMMYAPEVEHACVVAEVAIAKWEAVQP